jgi:hypothetical protein
MDGRRWKQRTYQLHGLSTWRLQSKHFNCHILPHLKLSPNGHIFGLVVNTGGMPDNISTAELNPNNISIQMAYVGQQRTAQIVMHANKRKLAFDKNVLEWAPKEVIFKVGQLVQVYRSNLDFTVSVDRKMVPKWSAPVIS